MQLQRLKVFDAKLTFACIQMRFVCVGHNNVTIYISEFSIVRARISCPLFRPTEGPVTFVSFAALVFRKSWRLAHLKHAAVSCHRLAWHFYLPFLCLMLSCSSREETTYLITRSLMEEFLRDRLLLYLIINSYGIVTSIKLLFSKMFKLRRHTTCMAKRFVLLISVIALKNGVFSSA